MTKKSLSGERIKASRRREHRGIAGSRSPRGRVDVLYVAEFSSGITDDEVLDRARIENRLLLTGDKDFGELVFRMKRQLAGVIMLRLPCAPGARHWDRLRAVLARHGSKLQGHYTVIDQARVRFRPLTDAEPRA